MTDMSFAVEGLGRLFHLACHCDETDHKEFGDRACYSPVEVSAYLEKLRVEWTVAFAERTRLLEIIAAAVRCGRMIYSRDRGEPEPTPAFPIHVEFSMESWKPISEALVALDKKEP